MFFLEQIVPHIYIYLRSFIKWFLHRFTNLCELQRLCYGAKKGSSRTKKVESSLTQSKRKEIQDLLHELDEIVEYCNDAELYQIPYRAVMVVQTVKRIKPKVHPDFSSLFGQCVLHIWSYRKLMNEVERLRAEAYNDENLEHEEKLLELWNNLMPKTPLSARVTRQWQEIGFQGDDPKTDFRGMGLLGLENLLYFSRSYKAASQHVLLHSMHPTLGYTFAIVGINLTSLAYRLLKSGDAKTHFYNLCNARNEACCLEHFHKFYSFLFFEFDHFWLESEPTSIMDFRDIYQAFEITILEALHNDETMFKTNLVVEEI